MPRRGERHKFDPEIFTANPLEGRTPEEAYRLLRWGNAARQTFTIQAPEPLVALGELAQLVAEGGGIVDAREQVRRDVQDGCHGIHPTKRVRRPRSCFGVETRRRQAGKRPLRIA